MQKIKINKAHRALKDAALAWAKIQKGYKLADPNEFWCRYSMFRKAQDEYNKLKAGQKGETGNTGTQDGKVQPPVKTEKDAHKPPFIPGNSTLGHGWKQHRGSKFHK